MSEPLEISVVGMQYRLAPATLRKLGEDCPLRCELRREPNNLHDSNAILVVVIEKPWAKMHEGLPVGFLTRQVAAEFAAVMDEGHFPFDEVWLTAVSVEQGQGELLLKKRVRPKAKSKAK